MFFQPHVGKIDKFENESITHVFRGNLGVRESLYHIVSEQNKE